MKQHPTGAETADRNGDVLRFPTSRTFGVPGVRLTFDTNASLIVFEQVYDAGQPSKLTVSHNGTRLIGRLNITTGEADGSPAQRAFITDWACPTTDAS